MGCSQSPRCWRILLFLSLFYSISDGTRGIKAQNEKERPLRNSGSVDSLRESRRNSSVPMRIAKVSVHRRVLRWSSFTWAVKANACTIGAPRQTTTRSSPEEHNCKTCGMARPSPDHNNCIVHPSVSGAENVLRIKPYLLI